MKRTKSIDPGDQTNLRVHRARGAATPAVIAAVALLGLTNALPAQFYKVTKLTSDISGLAANTDSHLTGAWGIARTPTSPWWVNSTMGGVSLLFNGAGTPLPLVVTIPGPSGVTTAIATGVVADPAGSFLVAPGKPAHFIFATRNGTISGWNAGPTAVTMVDRAPDADYTGITIAALNGADVLYAANFGQNRIEAYDGMFQAVTLAAGAFADDDIPATFRVFNVQALGADVYVTYAPATSFAPTLPTAGQGYVDVYTPAGVLVRHLRHGRWMDAPWGVALAPADFGKFSNDVLVGMFGSGHIAAFDATTGEFRGWLRIMHGKRLTIAPGLWGLEFGNGANAGPANTLYFASDLVYPGGVFHGLFGSITVMPPSDNGLGADADSGNETGDANGN